MQDEKRSLEVEEVVGAAEDKTQDEKRSLEVEEVVEAVRAAERAAGKDEDRVERAVRAARAAMRVDDALAAHTRALGQGHGGRWATSQGLARALARATAQVVDPHEKEESPPHGDDWRTMSRAFAVAHVARPRSFDAYVAAERELPVRPGLAYLSAAGAYLVHLITCSRCRAAEKAGQVAVECEIHTLAVMLEGTAPVPGPKGAPAQRPPGPPRLPSAGRVSEQDRVSLARELAVEVALGTVRRLTLEEQKDPALCEEVAGMHVAYTCERPVPDEIKNMGVEKPIVVAQVAQLAQACGEREAAGYMEATRGMLPADHHQAMQAAWAAATAAGRPLKARPVPHLNKTSNMWSLPVGTLFPTVPDLVGGAAAGSVAITMDAVKAFRGLRLTPQAAAQQCMMDPATGDVYSPTGGVWGSNSIGAAYCAATGLLKEGVRGAAAWHADGVAVGPPLSMDEAVWLEGSGVQAAMQALLEARAPEVYAAQTRGEVRATGVADDIGIVVDQAIAAPTRVWARAVATAIGYTENLAKAQMGVQIAYGGMAVDLASGTPTLTLRVAKLFSFYADMALVAAVGRAGGYVPTNWLESAIGLMEWAAGVDAGVRLRRAGLRATLVRAKAKDYAWAAVGGKSTAGVAAAGMVARAVRGAARATRVVSVEDARPVGMRVSATPDGLQAMAPTTAVGGQRRIGVASDAGLNAARASWGVLIGTDRAMFGTTARIKGASSGWAETLACLEMARVLFEEEEGATIVWSTDSLGCFNAISKGRARYGTPLWTVLEELLLMAERYSINLQAVWVPRTMNTSADSLASRRSFSDAQAWAGAAGRRLVGPGAG